MKTIAPKGVKKTITFREGFKSPEKFKVLPACQWILKKFLQMISLDSPLQLIFFSIVVPNTLFDTAVLTIFYSSMERDFKILFFMSFVFNASSLLSILIQSIIIFKRKSVESSLSTLNIILLSIHLLGILVLSLEKAMKLESIEGAPGYGHLWTGWMFTLVFETLCSCEFFEKNNLRLINLIFGVNYLLIRSFSVWKLGYLLLLCPILSSLIKKNQQRNRTPLLLMSGRTEINEKRDGDQTTVSSKLGNKKRLETFAAEKFRSQSLDENFFYAKIFRVTCDAYLVFDTEGEKLIYINQSAVNILGSDPQSVSDAIRGQFYIIPLIEQDDKINPIGQENSSGSFSKTNQNSANNNVPSDNDRNERTMGFVSSYTNLINESLGSLIEKIKKKIKVDKGRKYFQTLSYNLRTKDIRDEEKKVRENGQMVANIVEYKELVLRKNFLVEFKGGREAKGCYFDKPKRSFEVELTFFEDLQNEDNSNKLFYIIKLRDLEGSGFIEKLQAEVDSFKSNFISTLSHELKTPLNCTINMLELLEYDLVKEREKNFLHLEKIQPALQNSRLLVSNINDVIDYSELVSNKFLLHPTKFCVRQFFIDQIDILSVAVKERGNNIKLEWDNRVREYIISDEARLSQVVLNLLSNANKFTINGDICLRVENYNDWCLKVLVKDTGMGIKQRELKKLGVLNGSKDRKLIGFGLTIANYIASVLSPPDKRGIFVRSRLGRGSVFSFYINHLEETKLKPSNISKSSRGSETFDQINLCELINLQISSRSSDKGQSGMINYLKADAPKEGGDNNELDLDKISQVECLRREDQESPGALAKNISQLGRLKKNMKFFQRLNDWSDSFLPDRNNDDRNDASQIKSVSEDKPSYSSLTEEMVFQDLKYFRKLFPLPTSVDLLINRTLKLSINEDERSNGSSKERRKITGQHRTLLNPLEKLDKSPKSPALSDICSRNLNMSNSYEENKIIAEKSLKRNLAENKKQIVAENLLEQQISSSHQKEMKLENIKDLISQLRKKKTCNCPELLLVDDNGYNLMVLRLMIESFGLKADSAKSGDEAISLVKKRVSGTACSICKLYYVILMDIDMPEKDGLETTAEILELIDEPALEPTVIACTAFHESEFGQRCFSVGMKDFITKPIKKSLLETVLLKHFEKFLS